MLCKVGLCRSNQTTQEKEPEELQCHLQVLFIIVFVLDTEEVDWRCASAPVPSHLHCRTRTRRQPSTQRQAKYTLAKHATIRVTIDAQHNRTRADRASQGCNGWVSTSSTTPWRAEESSKCLMIRLPTHHLAALNRSLLLIGRGPWC